MKKKKSLNDWRSLPRVPLAEKKTTYVGGKVSPAMAARIRENARLAGMTTIDWIVKKCS